MTTVEVVVPVYNEEDDTARNVPVLREFLATNLPLHGWLIVIGDNGSTDRTPAVAEELQQRYKGEVAYFRIPEKGKGGVIKQAWLASGADIVSFMDVDLSTGLEAFPGLISAIAEDGYDVAIGSRLHRHSKVRRSLRRRVLTLGYNATVRLLLRTSFKDAQCGFKAARRDVAQRVLPLVRDTGFFFDTEFLVIASRLGYRIKEVPVTWEEDERTSVRTFSTVAANLRGLMRLRAQRPWRKARKEGTSA
jgi:glycosyltransferase involved in cell wall biosynthesis